jgi:cathepsin B
MRGVSVALSLALLVVFSAAAAPQLVGATKEDNSLRIIQKDIIQTINKHPNAGWTAGYNPYFENYTIEQFKHILGVKPTPPALLAGVPTKSYSRSVDLPKEFDARSQWSGCSTIGTILGKYNSFYFNVDPLSTSN